jgi:hypothetical protein
LTVRIPLYNKGHIRTRETPAGDAGVAFKAGDAILTGAAKDSWPIAKTTFERTYAPAEGSRMGRDGKFFKKPVPVLGVQMKERFAVTATWGCLEGKPGDWLVQYDEGKDFALWIAASSNRPTSASRSLRTCVRSSTRCGHVSQSTDQCATRGCRRGA